MNFKKQIFKMLFNKRQRAVIWQAVLFSEHTYKRRGNVNGAAVVQTVINETEKTFGFDKRHFTKEEVDNIVAGVLNDSKAHLEEAFRKGSEVAEEKIKEAYNAGFKHCLDEIEKYAAEKEDNAAKHVKFHVSEIDLSGCKNKKEALEKAIGIIAADLIGEEKSDDKEDNRGSESGEDEEQDDSKSDDDAQEGDKTDDKTE